MSDLEKRSHCHNGSADSRRVHALTMVSGLAGLLAIACFLAAFLELKI